ncbi:hypothetical protein [Cryptosporidium parvum Iowa II]|uniref:Uncharacterized protein n=2 Tax=Cryptosporidium parvum TaxID=5807 RepID=Q5CQ58_CRYPI|nr:hypothetical protein [Cryptosporidium parvum Iowa II]EAK87553.1 hypothetical protein cgd5_4040 [Cryptosporidium parvum Iowa II]QOY41789.1 Uncharacterized protein CPATCC_0025390 [Cryptosporidium parvum]WKS78011.1 hypothetical protein CPCDC_5g4040 [Cryptosporidium sp. 43IA8]WRK32501.1 Uncharacterized protein cpbgf_5004040 [Cryptosporidium parvum]|eukprot:QOY41789.1 hypothetical protein CPATCC_002388 [Cryptosporidium parvum]
MARKRRYGSAIGGEHGTESPYLESINLPDENYYRNMTESPMELDQPHMSTNPIKHGLSRANMNNMIMQDRYNKNMEARAVPKVRRKRTLIPQESVDERNEINHSRILHQNENVDIFQDDLSSRNYPTNHSINNNSKNTFMYNTRSKAMSMRQVGANILDKSMENSLRKRAEKGSSNLPPLPRTEDYWPKINKDTTQDHEEYLNSIRDQHFSRSKNDENIIVNGSNIEFNNKPEEYQSNVYSVNDGIYSIETPLKSFRSEMVRTVNGNLIHVGSSKEVNREFVNQNYRQNHFNHEHEKANYANSNRSYLENRSEKSIVNQNIPVQKQFHQKGIKIHCDAMVGGDTPLRDINLLQENQSDDVVELIETKTSEIGVGPSPKVDITVKRKELSESSKREEAKQRTTGSILRKSIDASDDNYSKQVRFSSRRSKVQQKEETLPEFEELKFDPGEIPLIDYQEHEDRFDTIDFDQENGSNVKIDYNKMLDTMTVDSNICLRLVQLSKEEIRLFEKSINQKNDNEGDQSGSSCNYIDDELMIKAISGIHKYFLNKAFEHESEKELELHDIMSWIPEVKYNEDKYQTVNSERDELISKIGLLNLNINRLNKALEEAEELNSRLFSSGIDKNQEDDHESINVMPEDFEYILKSTNILLNELESTKTPINQNFESPKANSRKEEGEQENSDVDKSDTSNLCSPTPVISFEDNGVAEIDPNNIQENKKPDIDIDELLNECHQSQFIQMESIAVLNDCMSLLDDAEIGMQNFQRLLAKKAFDTIEEDEQQHVGYNSNGDSMEVVEDTLLRIQKGASITPRFSLEESLNYRRSSVGSRKSIGGNI